MDAKTIVVATLARAWSGAGNHGLATVATVIVSLTCAVAMSQEAPAPKPDLSAEQEQIAEKFQHLEKVLLRMAELNQADDPRRTALLKKAVRLSGDRLIDLQFEQLAELLSNDQFARAMENQKDLHGDLQAMLELLLSENRQQRVRAEKARIRDYLKRINRLIKQQKDVQGRTEHSENPDQLSDQQGQLAERAGEISKDIKQNEEGKLDESSESTETPEDPSEGKPGEGKPGEGKPGEGKPGEGKPGEGKPGEGKPGEGKSGEEKPGEEKPSEQESGDKSEDSQDQEANPARERLDKARSRMQEAQEKLEEAQREGAVEKQEEALRELELAKAELEEILRQLREEEITRMLAMLQARFRKMLQLQREVYEGTTRLDAIPEAERRHTHEIRASRLGTQQTQIVLEADKALLMLRDDGTAVAFPEAIEQMRDDMQQVAQRLAQAKVGQITQAIEEDILAALEEMIEALKKAQKEAEERQQQPPRPSSGEQEPSLVDKLAELRMIRALQMRVNRRTERYSKLIEGEQADKPDLIEALGRLAERERKIHRVTRDLEMGKNR